MIIGIEAQRVFRRKKHGMEVVALEIARALQQNPGNDQYVLFARKDEDEDCLANTEQFTIKTFAARTYFTWEQFLLPRMVKKIKPQLLHCTANTAPLFCSTPLVVTIHDVIYLESVSFGGSAYQNFGNLYRRFIVPRIARKARIIITVSEFEKKKLAQRLKLPEDKIRVVYNGVNPQFKKIDDQKALEIFRHTYQLPEAFLLHFGNTAPKKNTIGALRAFNLYCASASHILPLVITDCEEKFITGLLEEIGAPSLRQHLRILDYVPFEKIPLLYNLATVFLYPSHRESFGMPVIEAMACGTPVVTSTTSSLPEISGGAACMVDPTDAEGMAAVIQQLLTDKILYKQKQEQGYKNAARFNWKLAAQKTTDIYNELR
jgi:glycosyltransferase involved in cell wall biosynthesis